MVITKNDSSSGSYSVIKSTCWALVPRAGSSPNPERPRESGYLLTCLALMEFAQL